MIGLFKICNTLLSIQYNVRDIRSKIGVFPFRIGASDKNLLLKRIYTELYRVSCDWYTNNIIKNGRTHFL